MARLTTPKEPTVMVARSSGVIVIRGTEYTYRLGQPFPANHPLVRKLPERFRPLELPEVNA